MSSKDNPEGIENFMDDFRVACGLLQDIGVESIVLLATKDKHVQIGSQKGIEFLEDNNDVAEEFYQNCQGIKHSVKEKKEILKRLEARLPKHDKMKHDPSIKTVQVAPNITLKVIPEPAGTSKEIKEEYKELKESDFFEDQSEDEKDQFEVLGDEAEDFKIEIKDFQKESEQLSDDADDGDSVISVLDNEDDFSNENSAENSPGVKVVVVKNKAPQTGKRNAKRKATDSKSPKRRKAAKKSGGPKKGVKSEAKPSLKGPFYCSQCNKKYVRQEDLIIHERIHTGETPYKCGVCGKAFRSQGLLRSHKVSHSYVRPYVCDTCGQQFARQTNLKRHTTTVHTSEGQYNCETCGKNFKDQSVYRLHKMRHAEDKPYSCDTCGKRFLCSYLLASHWLMHTGEKPYSCAFCNARFRTKRFLTLHNKRMHLKKPIVVVKGAEDIDGMHNASTQC